MYWYSRLASVLAKRRSLSRSTVAAGGVICTYLVSREDEVKIQDQNSEHGTRKVALFPSYGYAACDFDSQPPKLFQRIRRRDTQRKMREEMAKRKLANMYNVEWSRPLGEGGFGAVYLGKCKHTGALAAVKQISKNYTSDTGFQREMDAFLHIRKQGGHPNLCGLRENFDEGGFYYLVLDLIQGGEMFDHLVQDGAYSEADAARLVREVGSALSFLHGIGIVHCDLKPENLMLSSENSSDAVVKLVDFGCAEIIDKNSPYYCPPEGTKKCFSNTPGYSPPEMLVEGRSGAHLEPSVDMFSIGVIIYIMLTGLHPFDISGEATDEELNQRIARQIMPPLRNSPITAHLSESAKDLIEKLLDPNPKTRMTALEMLNHPWVKGETAKKGKITDSEKKLKGFRKCQSGLEAKVFASMVQFADTRDSEDAARKTSLLARSFKSIDSENRGYITTKDLDATNSKEKEEDPHLSLSGFSDLLSEHMKNVYLPAGHVIFEEGDKGDSMFFLNSGRVEVTTRDGFKTTTEQGDFFGEGVLVKKEGGRSATIKCLTPVHAIEIGRDYFEKYVADGFEIELALIERDRLRRQERAKSILRLQNHLNSEVIRNGDYVYRKWEDGDDIFLLEEGLVDIDVDGNNVYTVKAGELLGEYSMIFGRNRNTNARCVSDRCKIEVMELKDFEGMIKSNPSIRDGLRDVVFRREFKKALAFATKKPFPSTEAELKEAFEKIDLDKSGLINFDEIRVLLREMDKTFTDDDIAQILESLDLDGAGKIQWAEFKRIFGMHCHNAY